MAAFVSPDAFKSRPTPVLSLPSSMSSHRSVVNTGTGGWVAELKRAAKSKADEIVSTVQDMKKDILDVRPLPTRFDYSYLLM